jgi:hypothetical protein
MPLRWIWFIIVKTKLETSTIVGKDSKTLLIIASGLGS